MKADRSHRPRPPTSIASVRVSAAEIAPRALARARVRAMRASMVRSTRQLIAAAAPATSAMPSEATRKRASGGKPGVARNMPIIAVNTISELTRGLHRSKNAARRCVRVSARRAVVFMVSSNPGVFEQALEVGADALEFGAGRVAHHRQAVGVDEDHAAARQRTKGGSRGIEAQVLGALPFLGQ